MSLINDVLKDLEQRQGRAPEVAPRSAGTRPLPRKRPAQRWPFWLLAAVAAGLVLHLSLDAPETSKTESVTGPLVAQAETRPHATAARPDPLEAAMPPASGAREAATPPPTSNPAAGTGASEQVAQAAAAPVAAAQREEEDDRQDASAQGATSETGPRTSGTETTRASNAGTVAGQDDAPEQDRPTETEAEEAATISIRRSDTGGEESDPLAAAKRLLANGQFGRGEARLRRLLEERPDLTEAHELLASSLIQRRRHQSATSALEAGLEQAREPARLAVLLGRLLIERGEVNRARSILTEHAPPMSEAPAYHLLLAAAYRQAGEHSNAAQHYRALSEFLPRHGAVWIGLGASLESLERPQEAVEAYNRALDSDDERAARFARTRLSALERTTGESQ